MWNFRQTSVFVAVLVQLTNAAINQTPKSNIHMDTREQQTEYLRHYHYLGELSPSNSMRKMTEDHPDEAFHTAVKRLQQKLGLEPTGEVDQETKRVMEMPRCGFPDIITEEDAVLDSNSTLSRRKRRFAIIGNSQGTGFSSDDVTYRIGNFPSQDLNEAETREVIRRAFQLWADVTPLTFTEVNRPADIEILFASRNHFDGAPFDGNGGELAHALVPTSGTWQNIDVHYDDQEIWTLDYNSRSVADLLQVATHEFGHALGLAHSDRGYAVMAPVYNYKTDFSLTSDDIAGIQYIYGANNGGGVDNGGGENTPPPPEPNPFCSGEGPMDAIWFDGISNVYIFKGDQIARVSGGEIAPGFPKLISEEFKGLPSNLDAVMHVPSRFIWQYCGITYNGRCYWYPVRLAATNYAFKGDTVYEYKNGAFQSRGLIRQNFPGIPSDLDAAFFGTDSKVYFIKGNQYWVMSATLNGVSSGYPKLLDSRRSPFRYLDVKSLDASLLAMSRYGYVNYVVSGDMIYSVNLRNGDIPYSGSVKTDVYGCSEIISFGHMPEHKREDILLNNETTTDMIEFVVQIDENGDPIDLDAIPDSDIFRGEENEFEDDNKDSVNAAVTVNFSAMVVTAWAIVLCSIMV